MHDLIPQLHSILCGTSVIKFKTNLDLKIDPPGPIHSVVDRFVIQTDVHMEGRTEN